MNVSRPGRRARARIASRLPIRPPAKCTLMIDPATGRLTAKRRVRTSRSGPYAETTRPIRRNVAPTPTIAGTGSTTRPSGGKTNRPSGFQVVQLGRARAVGRVELDMVAEDGATLDVRRHLDRKPGLEVTDELVCPGPDTPHRVVVAVKRLLGEDRVTRTSPLAKKGLAL